MNGHRLYYFTFSYPYGLGEMWKANELEVLRHHFDRIIVVPYCYGGKTNDPKSLPDGVELRGPLFEAEHDEGGPSRRLPHVFGTESFYFMKELLTSGALKHPNRLRNWLRASSRIVQLRRHPVVRRLIAESDSKTAWYFYWGRGSCDLLPFLGSVPRGRTLVRMHGYDLYEHRNAGYIPYRRPLLKSADVIAPTSSAGFRHLVETYPAAQSRVSVQRCGTVSAGRGRGSGDGVFRLVSCSQIIPLKRISLLIDALHQVRSRMSWTHLGEGELRRELEERCRTLPSHVTATFGGQLPSHEVLPYYLARPLDLFVNVSTTEGVPFSVMEALSVGIPVVATAVGGTPEIVDDAVGRLLPADVAAEQLASVLEEFAALPADERSRLRDAAYCRYQERCDAHLLAETMARLLIHGQQPPDAEDATDGGAR